MTWTSRLSHAFGRGPRLAASSLALIGSGLAAWSGVDSVQRDRASSALVYLAVCIALIALTAAMLLSWRIAEWIFAAILFVGCIPGTLGSAAELIVGVDPAKAAEVQALGVDPRLAVGINLAYCIAGAAIAVWLAVRLRRLHDSAG